MKILFTADWHIKLTKKKVPKDWQINRYYLLANELNQLKYDILIIGGDIYDKVPTLEEQDLFHRMLSILSPRLIYIYDGNHEATKRNETFLKYEKFTLEKLFPNVKVITEETVIQNCIDVIPYCKLRTFNKNEWPKNKILCTHVRGYIPPYVIPEIDLKLLEGWDLVLAGDLHDKTNSQLNIIYPGEPLSNTFHRELVTKGIMLVDSETLETKFIKLDLPQMLIKTVESEEEIEIENNTIDLVLFEVKQADNLDNSLVDKILNDEEDSDDIITSNLKENLSIEEELTLYMKNILNFSQDTISEHLKIFHDTIKTT